jgi:hypothetical protein
MVEILLSAVPFADVKHTGDTILRASKQLLAGYGVGQYECSFTASGTEIVLVDTVFPCYVKTFTKRSLTNETNQTQATDSPHRTTTSSAPCLLPTSYPP